ncbi:MAG: TetR/AcrR family transcriptional regulator [Nitrososphaerales archaeon]|nr:TetR/AcrR family transcriptional regulator [Nitrososphaerales archaeon]
MQTHEQGVMANRILQVASKLFAEKGYSNVSIREVCRETGTSAPVIYYYFRSKKGLFEAVARSRVSMGDFVSKLAKATETKDPAKGLESFVSLYLSSFPEHAFDPGLYLRDSATLDRRSARMISADMDKIRTLATNLIGKCIEDGRFRGTDRELAAECLLGMLNRVIFQHLHFAKASDRAAYGRFVTDFFFRAMK